MRMNDDETKLNQYESEMNDLARMLNESEMMKTEFEMKWNESERMRNETGKKFSIVRKNLNQAETEMKEMKMRLNIVEEECKESSLKLKKSESNAEWSKRKMRECEKKMKERAEVDRKEKEAKKGGGGLEELKRKGMERLRGQVVGLQRELQEAKEGIAQLQEGNDRQAAEIALWRQMAGGGRGVRF